MADECEDCHLDLEVFDEKNTNPEHAIDENGDHFPYWKVSDCAKASFLFCPDCKILYAKCKKCDELMFSTGHMGFHQDGTQHMRNANTKMKAHLEKPSAIKDLTKPRFDTSDLFRHKLRLDEWMPSGPDDTYPHFWSCPSCSEHFSFSGK